MNTTKILDSEIIDLKISSLPSRPTAPTSFGGKGYTSVEMRAAFDKLPLFIIKRFNALLDDISAIGEGSLSAEIPTGIAEGHTLLDFFSDVTSGELSTYLTAGEESLAEMKARLLNESESVEERLGILFLHIADTVLDASHPKNRNATDGEVKI